MRLNKIRAVLAFAAFLFAGVFAGVAYPQRANTTTGVIVIRQVTDEVYGAGWDGSLEVPTKNALFDKIEALGGAGAPTDATYITQTANGSLSAEQALASLSTGIMRVATTTGIVTSLTDSAGIFANISDETGGTGVLVGGTSPTFTTSILVGADGVSLTDSGNGILTFLGLGDGSDEDLSLNLDDVSNTGTFTSSTSLATINFSSIALQESGIAVLNNDEIDASSELLAIMDDETGTGVLVFGTAPVFTTSIEIPVGLSSALPLKFTGATTTGFYRGATDTAAIVFRSANFDIASVSSNGPGLQLSSDSFVVWTSGSANPQGTKDLFLGRDAANTLAQRNGTTAQVFRVYETFTDPSNYELGGITMGSNIMAIATGTAGTGSDDLTLTLAASGAGIVSSLSTFKAAGYQSSDGSAGVTVTTCTSFKNGLCVAGT